jgi:hypothetical protein
MFAFLTKSENNRVEQVLHRGEGEGGGGPNNVYTYKEM